MTTAKMFGGVQLPRHKQNLAIKGNAVYSYSTEVARIDYEAKTVTRLGYWSSTTARHISHVARHLGFRLV